MPHRTKIEWADYSTNPLRAIVGGKQGHMCTKISEGCVNCYSEAINHVFGNQADYNAANCKTATHYIDEKALAHILKFRPKGPFKGTDRPKVFPFDMTDIFGSWVSDEMIDRVWGHFARRPDVDFLVLTKRAERLCDYMNRHDVGLRWAHAAGVGGYAAMHWTAKGLPNVWLGVSVENQKRADERIPLLKQTPAAIRFLSCEPLLGPIDLSRDGLWNDKCPVCIDQAPDFETNVVECRACDSTGTSDETSIEWVIVGGESGPKARPCDINWIRSIVAQCGAKGIRVPVFVKQLGSVPFQDDSAITGAPLDRSNLTRLPAAAMEHSKGGDPAEWPADLRVRQFPRMETAA